MAAGLVGSLYVLWKAGRPGFPPGRRFATSRFSIIVIMTAVTSELPCLTWSRIETVET